MTLEDRVRRLEQQIKILDKYTTDQTRIDKGVDSSSMGWDGEHLRVGRLTIINADWTNPIHVPNPGVYFWVDGTGTFRIHSGPPSNDLDGSVVGTQT